MEEKMKTKLTKMLTCVLGAVAVLCFSLAIMVTLNSNGKAFALENARIESTEIQEKYDLNSDFTPPTVTLVAEDGTEVQASATNAILVFPDGIAYKANAHKLSQLGEYQLIYTTDTYTASTTFDVIKKNWSVSSNFSSAEFVEKLEFSTRGKSGIRVELADGDTFRYNVPINVYDHDILDVITAYPRISEKDSAGTVTMHAVFMLVRLVDAYDASNYIEFYLWAASSGGFYTGAGASYQPLTGLEFSAAEIASSNSKKVIYEGSNYRRHVVTRWKSDAQYGASCGQSSFAGLCNVGGMNFQFNTVNNQVYRSTRYLHANGYEYLTERRTITDLDAPELYQNYGERAFEGFTTGEVYLELKGELYKSSSITIDIESIYGREGDALLEQDYYDEVAPVIDIDVNPTNDSGINIPVGEIFTVPSATVFDTNYTGIIKPTVWYNYGTEEQSQVLLKDGKFTPVRAGTYAIEYVAVDAYGNQAVEVLKVNALNKKAIQIDESKVAKLYAGEMNTLPAQNQQNINGKMTAEIFAIDPMGKKIAIDSETSAFEPKVLGEYEIVYVFTDNVYTIEWSYTVECVDDHENVNFYDQITLPPAFIKNATYTFDAYYAYTIDANGLVPHLADVYVSVDGGAETKLSAEQIASYKVTGSDNLTITYEYNGKRTTPVVVDIIDVDYNLTTATATKMTWEDYSKYFVGNYVRNEANYTAVGYYFDGTRETETMTFANVLSLANFEFTINGLVPWTKDHHEDGSNSKTVDMTNFSKIEIKLTDYINNNKSISFVYEQVGPNLVYTADGISTSFAETDMSTIANTLKANRFTKVISNSNGVMTALPQFESDKCFLTITISGITDECAIAIRKVGNQAFHRTMKTSEGMAYYDIANGTMVQGTLYTISPCQLTNVLHPITEGSATLTVTNPAGNVVKDVNGLALENVVADRDYQVEVNDVGFYLVTYTKTLVTGESKIEQYPINVTDTEPPIIKFNDGLDETKVVNVERGRRHYIRKFTVTDNIDVPSASGLYYTIYILKGSNQFVDYIDPLKTEDPYWVFAKTGTYKVMVFASDSAGNSTWTYYNVNVK